MNASAYPTLDLLGQYGLRQAYLILMLGARSGTHLQRLHDEVIPLDCRLHRNLFIELKKERERLFASGGEEGGVIRQGPSDKVLLMEFNTARRAHRQQKPSSLLDYYMHQLYEHASRDQARKPVRDTNLGNYGLLVRLSDDVLGDLGNCKLNGVETGATLSVHHQSEQTSPPKDLTLPEGYVLTKIEKTLRLRLWIMHLDVHHLSTPSLLELPQWDGYHADNHLVTIYYQFLYPDAIQLPAPDVNEVIVIDKATLTALLAFLAERGIPLEPDLTTVP